MKKTKNNLLYNNVKGVKGYIMMFIVNFFCFVVSLVLFSPFKLFVIYTLYEMLQPMTIHKYIILSYILICLKPKRFSYALYGLWAPFFGKKIIKKLKGVYCFMYDI